MRFVLQVVGVGRGYCADERRVLVPTSRGAVEHFVWVTDLEAEDRLRVWRVPGVALREEEGGTEVLVDFPYSCDSLRAWVRGAHLMVEL